MSSSLSGLVDILSDAFHCDEWIDCKSYVVYMITKDAQLKFRCFECKMNYQRDFNKDLINRFADAYEFCNKDIDKFISLLRKEIYPYEYTDSWERIGERSLPDKEAFYSSLNIEGIRSFDYRHAKRICKEFRINNLGDYHDLYVQSDALLLVDVFEKFRNKYIEIYDIDPSHFLSAPELAWHACLKKTKVKLELLTDIDMLLMFEKGTRGGICHSIHRHAKANNKYIKNCDKNKESPYLMYLDASKLYGWAMSKKLLANGFKWKKSIHKFDEDFIKKYDEDSNKKYVLQVDVNLHDDPPFLAERKKI